MSIFDDLFNALKNDAPVTEVRACAHWTAVVHAGGGCGLAGTLLACDMPHGESQVRDVGRLQTKTARELAGWVTSSVPLEVSIGMAALNSLIVPDESRCIELNAREFLLERGKGKRVAMIGHFPFIPKLRQAAEVLWVLEQTPGPGEYPPEAAPDLLPQADLIAITASTLINHTFDQIAPYWHSEATVMMLGPSTPLSPVLFDHGISVISGAQVVDVEAALRTISQGATFRQVEGVRLLTMTREDML